MIQVRSPKNVPSPSSQTAEADPAGDLARRNHHVDQTSMAVIGGRNTSWPAIFRFFAIHTEFQPKEGGEPADTGPLSGQEDQSDRENSKDAESTEAPRGSGANPG
jgi:hypothetical protein